MKKINFFDWLAILLVSLGAIELGLLGFFDFKLIATVFRQAPLVESILYDFIGIAGVYFIISMLVKEVELK